MRVPKYSTETEGTSDNPSPRYPTMSGRMNDKKASAERDEESQFLLLHVDNATFSLWQEAQNLCAIALPSVAAQFNLYFLFPLSASFVGRYGGTADLAGYSLGSLTGNITCLSVVLGALGAADMLMPRAVGAQDYPELGRLAIRAAFVCALLLLPPTTLLSSESLTTQLLVSLGQDHTEANLAARWIGIYLWGQPANALFRVMQRFLVAQHKPWPPVYASFVTVLAAPGLHYWLVPTMGIEGSALSIVLTQWLMVAALFLYLMLWPKGHPEAWPSNALSWSFVQESLQVQPVWRFISIAVAGVFSFSEWWHWEIMTFLAGSYGVVPLAAHTIAYTLVPLLYMICLGVSIGLVNRMGHMLAYEPKYARLMASWTVGFVVLLALLATTLLMTNRRSIIHLFSEDHEVVQMALQIWPYAALYIFLNYLYGILGAILRALERQWQMAGILVGCLWFVNLPLVFWFAVHQGGHLVVQWRITSMSYILLNIFLVIRCMTIDWSDVGYQIRRMNERTKWKELMLPSENSPLIHGSPYGTDWVDRWEVERRPLYSSSDSA